MRYVKSVPLKSGTPGSTGKTTKQTSALLQKLRKRICCVLIGTMVLGAGAPGSLAMDRDGSPWPLNRGDEGEIGPDTEITITDETGNQASCSATCTLGGIAGNSAAALAQEAGPSYRPTGENLEKIWRDIVEQLMLHSIIIGGMGFKEFSALTNLPKAKAIYAGSAVGSLGVSALRAYFHFALTQFLATLKKSDGSRRFTDQQVDRIAWTMNTLCKGAIAGAIGYVIYKADDWAKDPGRRRKILSGDFDGLGHGEVGNRIRDLLMTMDKAYVAGRNLILPTPLPTCPSQVIELPEVEFGSDNSVNIRHWSFGKLQPTVTTNSNTLASFPVKIVADGDRHWMLANKEASGFNIYRMNQYSSWEVTLAESDNWTKIPGMAIDLFPGPTFVFAINSNKDVFQCAWPCDKGNWSKIGNGDFKAASVAVGPSMLPNGDTTGQPVYVWLKDSHGHHKRRLEKSRLGSWQRINSRSEIPPRIRALLDERDTYDSWANWHLRYKYPALRR